MVQTTEDAADVAVTMVEIDRRMIGWVMGQVADHPKTEDHPKIEAHPKIEEVGVQVAVEAHRSSDMVRTQAWLVAVAALQLAADQVVVAAMETFRTVRAAHKSVPTGITQTWLRQVLE